MRHWTDRGFALIHCTLREGVLPCPKSDIECYTRTLSDGSHMLITEADLQGNSFGHAPFRKKKPVMVAHVRDATTFTPIVHAGQGFPVFPDSTTALHAALGIAFATIVKEWLTESDWREMLKANANEARPDLMCHSHDYCDPNQAMLDALEEFRYRYVLGEKASAISTQAWNYAKRTYFTCDGVPAGDTIHAVRPLAPRTEVPLGETPALVNQLAAALDDIVTLFEGIDADSGNLQDAPEYKCAKAALEQHRLYLNATAKGAQS